MCKRVPGGQATVGQPVQAQWPAAGVPVGFYLARLVTSTVGQNLKRS